MAGKGRTQKVCGQPSWRVHSDLVEAWVTVTGGHLAPVTFQAGARQVQPFSIAPWAEEDTPADLIPILKVLRGDFFCMPFGGNSEVWRGEQHPVHGETANNPWTLVAAPEPGDAPTLHARLQTTVRPGTVDKYVRLRAGQAVVYQQHVVSGMRGPMAVGHHATLAFPDRPGAGRLSMSPFRFGQVYLTATEQADQGGYSVLKPAAVFTSLERVPTITGETTDLSRYPARRGYEDIAILVSDPGLPFHWTAVAFPEEGYVWYALKDPRVLAATLLWMSNGGRYYAPWNGRHRNVMGLEEVTSHFHEGLAASARANSLTARGFPTALDLDPDRPLVVNMITGVAPIPPTFERVATLAAAPGGIRLTAPGGDSVVQPVDLDFLHAAPLG